MVTLLTKDPFELVEDIGDLTFEHVKGHLGFSEVSGEEKGRGKPKEQSKNSVNAKEDKGRVLPENREQSENLANVNEDKKIVKEDKEIVNEDKEIVNEDKEIVNEDKGIVWKKLEKEAADAVARAAAAVSDRLPVEKTILIIAKASEAVLALVESVGEESEEAERVQRRIQSLHKLSILASKESQETDDMEKVKRLPQDPPSLSTEALPLIKSSKDCSGQDGGGKRRRQPAKEELRRRQEEHLRRSLLDDNPL